MIQENITTPALKTKGYILVIDDEDNVLSMFASYLENLGYQVNMAKDGSEAKVLIDQNIYDIALLDICLPDCNGLDLLKELKEIHPTLDVIVCTGHSEDYDFFGAVKAGAADWISKPCNLQELHAKIERIRREQKQIRELSKKNHELEKIKKETEHVLTGMKDMLQKQDSFTIKKRTTKRSDFPEIIGDSKKLRKSWSLCAWCQKQIPLSSLQERVEPEKSS